MATSAWKMACRLYDLRQKAWHVHFNGQREIDWLDFFGHFNDEPITDKLTASEQMDIGYFMIKEFGVSWSPSQTKQT